MNFPSPRKSGKPNDACCTFPPPGLTISSSRRGFFSLLKVGHEQRTGLSDLALTVLEPSPSARQVPHPSNNRLSLELGVVFAWRLNAEGLSHLPISLQRCRHQRNTRHHGPYSRWHGQIIRPPHHLHHLITRVIHPAPQDTFHPHLRRSAVKMSLADHRHPPLRLHQIAPE